MKKTLVIIILGLLVFILVFFMIKNDTIDNSLNDRLRESEAILEREKSLASQRDHFLSLNIKSNGTLINKNLSLENEIGEKFILNDILSSKKLVFRYSELHCDVCVDEQVKSLKKIKAKIGNNNILILADYSNIKNLILFKRLNSIELPVYKLSEKLNLELDKKDVPYFFVLDSSLVAYDFFIPIKEIDDYTNKYLKIIFEKHFNNKIE